MLTTIYLMRHSKIEKIDNYVGNTLKERNENVKLSKEGRTIIENKLKNNELINI